MIWTQSWVGTPALTEVHSICVTGENEIGQPINLIFNVANTACEITTEVDHYYYDINSIIPVSTSHKSCLSIKADFSEIMFAKEQLQRLEDRSEISDDELLSLLEG